MVPDANRLVRRIVEIGQELVLLHRSTDNKWALVQSPYSHGWIKIKSIGQTDHRKTVSSYIHPTNFAIALDFEVPVYEDIKCRKKYTVLHMGSRLPLVSKDEKVYTVLIPARDRGGELVIKRGYMRSGPSVSSKYLPLTRRNIATQAFKMLHSPCDQTLIVKRA